MKSKVFLIVCILMLAYINFKQGGIFAAAKVADRLFSNSPRRSSDFYQFWAAARDLRAGRSIYTPLADSFFRHQANLGHTAFGSSSVLPVNAYPPFAILVFLPYSYLNYSVAFDWWIWCSIGMLATSIAIIVNRICNGLSWWKRAVAVILTCAAVAGSASLKHEVELGNVGGLLLLLTSLAWASGKREGGSPTWAGLFASLAFLIKLYPGLLFLYFWFANRAVFWRMMIWTGLFGLIGLTVVGWSDHVNFVRGLHHSERWYGYAYNHSEFGYWHHLFGASMPSQHVVDGSFSIVPLLDCPGLAKSLSFGTAASLLAILIWAGKRASGRGVIAREGLFAMTVVGMVLISPISWPSSLLLLILPLAILLKVSNGPGLFRGLVVVAALVLWFYPTMWEWRLRPIASRPYEPWDSLTHLGFKTYAMLGLYAMAGWVAVRLPNHPASHPPLPSERSDERG
jgi:Glycosyltransferase family 87